MLRAESREPGQKKCATKNLVDRGRWRWFFWADCSYSCGHAAVVKMVKGKGKLFQLLLGLFRTEGIIVYSRLPKYMCCKNEMIVVEC